jgi:hypothetical protein
MLHRQYLRRLSGSIIACALVGCLILSGVAAAHSGYRAELRHLRAEQAGAVYGILLTNDQSHFVHCPYHRGIPGHTARPRCRFYRRVWWVLVHRADRLAAEVVRLEVSHLAG